MMNSRTATGLLIAAGLALTVGAIMLEPGAPADGPSDTTLPSLGVSPSDSGDLRQDASSPESEAGAEPGPTEVMDPALLSEISPRVAQHLAEITTRGSSLQPGVFAKIGGSSTVNRGFLHCFTGRHVDLGTHADLQEALSFFREGRAGRQSPFDRVSLSAGVGWNTGYLLASRRPRYLQEVLRIRSRYAFLLAGGNDVGAHDAYGFTRRLTEIVDGLLERGVIPILGTLHPRRRRQHAQTVVSYNRAIRGIARAYRLPLIDYHRAMMPLESFGLAGDGVHPNVKTRGPVSLGCELTEDGLRFGNNVRNLLSLQMLDRLHRALDQASPSTREEPQERTGEGTAQAPYRLGTLPFASLEELSADREQHYLIELERPITLHLRSVGYSRRHNPSLHLDAETPGGDEVHSERIVELPAGEHRFSVRPHPQQPESARYLLTLEPEPGSNGGASNPT